MTTVQRIWRLSKIHTKLIGSECTNCGYKFFPPKVACPKCGSRELRALRLPSRGKVITYTIIRVPPRGFSKRKYIIIAVIDLGGVRVLSELVNCDVNSVKEGMEVEATIRKSFASIEEVESYIVKFKPVT